MCLFNYRILVNYHINLLLIFTVKFDLFEARLGIKTGII